MPGTGVAEHIATVTAAAAAVSLLPFSSTVRSPERDTTNTFPIFRRMEEVRYRRFMHAQGSL